MTVFKDGGLHGVKLPVLDGGIADVAIVAARGDEGLSLYLVELGSPSVRRESLTIIDPTRGQARIEFRGAPAELLARDGWLALTAAWDRAAVLTAFEQLGGAERAMEMARDYALERYAFGRPIGSFQAIKHKLADMYVAVTLARSNCYYGAWALAGLRSRGQRDGDDWIVNGQKIWTTSAQVADYGIMVVRNDPLVAKHAGLTMFIVDMKSSGVEVRPIRQMTGEHHFNEVFFTDGRVPDANRLGPVGGGWAVALTTLMNERLQLAAAIPTGVPEFFALCCELDTPDGKPIDNPAVRARLATWVARQRDLQWTMMRTISALSDGKSPGPENSIGKLVAGEIAQDLCAFALDLQGPAGAVVDEHGSERSFQKMLLSAASIRVGGGTAEIQRNILAEQVLGLPPDIRADKGMPFNNIPSGKH